MVAEPPCGERVPELVQAQRHDPAGDDENEHPGVGERPGGLACRPCQDAADRGDGHQDQEDRAGTYRLLGRADAHLHKATAHSRLNTGYRTLSARAASPRCAGRTSTGAPRAAPRHRRAAPVRRWCRAGPPARSPTGRAAAVRSAARARRPGMAVVGSIADAGCLAVEQHGVIDDPLAVDGGRVAGRQPVGGADDDRAGLVADQRNASRCDGSCAPASAATAGPRGATSTSSRSVRSSRVSTAARSASVPTTMTRRAARTAASIDAADSASPAMSRTGRSASGRGTGVGRTGGPRGHSRCLGGQRGSLATGRGHLG